ncbi:MAG: o-succinylbenzoate---CoA ligase, partial [Solirubrobacteraceae bacterium]|nr:o-succinylbenzoate---CoA ligase [Solirubrobacteraceae bacterium]
MGKGDGNISLSAVDIRAWLEHAAATHPDRVALEAEPARVTYAELHERAARAARRLAASGIAVGDRVALMLAPGPEFVETLHGCLLLGAPAMPIDLRLAAGERAAQAATAALVVDAPLDGPETGEVPLAAPHPADAVATVVHTSGTTGAPKPVELTYGNWAASARGSAAGLGVGAGERWLCALPLSHVGGLSIPIRSAMYGTTAVLHERFEADRVAAALRDDGITLTSLVPTMLARLLDAGLERPPALRAAVMGGAPLPDELCERAAAARVPLAQTYGLTESCSQVTLSAIGEPQTAGRALPGSTIELSPAGEILVGGATVAPGSLAEDGLLHTGDLGEIDEEDRLLVTGRAADTIVTGGENVAPAEVEEA